MRTVAAAIVHQAERTVKKSLSPLVVGYRRVTVMLRRCPEPPRFASTWQRAALQRAVILAPAVEPLADDATAEPWLARERDDPSTRDDALAQTLARAVGQRSGDAGEWHGRRLLARQATATMAAPAGASPAAKSQALSTVYAVLEQGRAEAEALDKEARADKHAYGQETGKGRDKLVSTLKRLRELIDALKPADVGGSAEELKNTRAALFRAAEHLAPYYYQIANANILGKKDPAGSRTCNITSIAMTLEALGKSPAEYKLPDKHLIPLIAAHFEPALSKASDWLSKDPSTLRLPDFLQLLAIAKFVPMSVETAQADPEAFAKVVSKARDAAVSHITVSSWFDTLIEGWGLKSHNVHPFKGKPGWEELIDRVGEINKGSVGGDEKDLVKKLNSEETKKYKALKTKAEKKANPKKTWTRDNLTAEQKKQVRDNVALYFNVQEPAKLRGQVGALEKQIASARAKIPPPVAVVKGKHPTKSKTERAAEAQVKKLETRLKSKQSELDASEALVKSHVNDYAGDPRALDKIIPIGDYKAIVSAALSKELDAGNQIVGHLYHHFVRVESVEEDGVIIDDPGGYGRKNHLFTWDEARGLGAFTIFNVISP